MKKAFGFFYGKPWRVFLYHSDYLAILLLLKVMESFAGIVRPLAWLLPESVPGEMSLSLLLVVLVCFLIGAGFRTREGNILQEGIEKALFKRIPGYALFKNLTQQIDRKSDTKVW